MKGLIIGWIVLTITVLITAYILPGIKIDKFSSAVWAAAALGILNAIVKPVLVILTLPITILTLGLFLLVINAVIILLVGALIKGFEVRSFGTAVIASIIISIISFVTSRLI